MLTKDNVLFVGVGGSWSYGTSRPESDVDLRGVFIHPTDKFLSYKRPADDSQQYVGWAYSIAEANGFPSTNVEEHDTHFFSLQKFLHLAAKCNPNVMDLLFMPEDCVLYTTTAWVRIQDMREKFLSQKIVSPLIGFAASQVKLVRKYTREDGSKDHRRGKAIMHGYRLMHMGLTFVNEGRYVVRQDTDFLNEMRGSEMSVEEFEVEMERLASEIKEAAKESPLPEEPDYEAIDALCVELQNTYG